MQVTNTKTNTKIDTNTKGKELERLIPAIGVTAVMEAVVK